MLPEKLSKFKYVHKKWTDEIKKLLHLSDLILNIKNTHPTIRVKMIILLSQFDSNLFS